MARSRSIVKPQDSGQPRPGSVGDPLAGRGDSRHPGTRKRRDPGPPGTAEGTDPSLANGPVRVRRPRSP